MALRIDHTVPPVPMAAGSYYLTTAGGYRFIYPVVALVQMTDPDYGEVQWRPAYIGAESELVDVPRDTDLVLMTQKEAACLWRTCDDLNGDRAVAEEEIQGLLDAAGTDGVDYLTVHRILWDARIEKTAEEKEFLEENACAVHYGDRVYAQKHLLADTGEDAR